ncbi:MAG: deoxyribonuclease V [Syntrophus sp. (in: bacteria)]|nr:deoxyribonuclease V [Syntrophus sp. (in: bacteria)]
MKTRELHRWDVTYREAAAIQEELRRMLILRDDGLPDPVRTVAGADISYDRGSDLFFAAVVLMRYSDLTVIEKATFAARVSFPYIPGLLTFREGPPLLAAFCKLSQTPDVVLFDGQGIAHPRGIGLASHLGLLLGLPSIGCAKTRLVGSHVLVGEKRGEWTEMVYQNRQVGAVLRTRERINPLFISQGHRIGLQRALALVLSCCRGYRIPEPIRQAHLAVNRLRTKQTATAE